MKVIRAKTMGMCFGVRDALALMRTIPNPKETTVYGELVHNLEVLIEITQRGMTMVSRCLKAAICWATITFRQYANSSL